MAMARRRIDTPSWFVVIEVPGRYWKQQSWEARFQRKWVGVQVVPWCYYYIFISASRRKWPSEHVGFERQGRPTVTLCVDWGLELLLAVVGNSVSSTMSGRQSRVMVSLLYLHLGFKEKRDPPIHIVHTVPLSIALLLYIFIPF